MKMYNHFLLLLSNNQLIFLSKVCNNCIQKKTKITFVIRRRFQKILRYFRNLFCFGIFILNFIIVIKKKINCYYADIPIFKKIQNQK